MKTIKIKLRQKSGLLSPLQSDTIYGHYCWRLKEKKGESKLQDFISLYKNYNPPFVISDGFIENNNECYIPNPLIFKKPKSVEKKIDQILSFVERKLKKDSKLISINDSIKKLNGFDSIIELISAEKGVGNFLPKESLRISVQIDRNSMSSFEGKLFEYNPVLANPKSFTSILIKILDEEYFEVNNCLNILKDCFETGFGKKKSSGYGQFTVEDISDFNEIEEPSDSNAFMVLGNYLPSKDDGITPLGYDINTKYGKLGEELSQSENPFKNPIVFLKAGSCFKVEKKKEFYGRVTNQGEISPSFKEAVQFGIPFIIHFKINT